MRDEWNEIPLAPFDGPPVEVVSWLTDIPWCACRATGIVAAFELFGVGYSALNVVLDDTGTEIDGPGFTHIYSRTDGIVRSTEMSPWFGGQGYGWDLLP